MNAAAVFCGGQLHLRAGGRGQRCRCCAGSAPRGGSPSRWCRWSSGGAGRSPPTRIRELLRAGAGRAGERMLGAPYALVAPVAHGKQIGGGKAGLSDHQPAVCGRDAAAPQRGSTSRRQWSPAGGIPRQPASADRPTVNGTDITCESFLIGFDGETSTGTRCGWSSSTTSSRPAGLTPSRGCGDCIADAASRSNAFFASCGLQIGQPEQF